MFVCFNPRSPFTIFNGFSPKLERQIGREEILQTAVFVFCFSLCMKENTGVVSWGDIFLQKEDRAALKAERIMCVKVQSERRKKEAGGKKKTGKQGVRQIQVLKIKKKMFYDV